MIVSPRTHAKCRMCPGNITNEPAWVLLTTRAVQHFAHPNVHRSSQHDDTLIGRVPVSWHDATWSTAAFLRDSDFSGLTPDEYGRFIVALDYGFTATRRTMSISCR